MLEAYLRELEGELSRRLPQEDVRARLTEAEAHLREGVEGRLELGLDPDAAERDAVSAYGAAQTVAKAVQREALAPRDVVRLRLLGVAYALFIAGLVGGPTLMEAVRPAYYATFVLGWLAVAGFAAASFRARRPAPVQVVSTGLAAAVVLWGLLGTTWLNLYAFGGGGVVPIGEVEEYVGKLRLSIALRTEGRRAFNAGWKTLNGAEGVEGLREGRGYRIPVLQRDEYYNDRLVVGYVSDPKAATQAWRDFRSYSLYYLDTTRETQNLAAVPAAQADPLGNLLNPMPDLIAVSLTAAGAAGTIDLAFSGLGALAFGLRRRFRRGGGLVV